MKILVPIENATSRDLYGGKGANLAMLSGLGVPIPKGVVVPADAFDHHLAAARQAADASDDAALRLSMLAQPVAEALAAELRQLCAELGGRVSIRSSATLEDARRHSFAGQFLTVLNVGEDGVADAVRQVWASAFTDNVRAYLRRARLDPARLRMAVVVQRQLDSRASGVAMGDRSQVTIEAGFGQGESFVSGDVVPDRWEVRGGRIATRRIAAKVFRRALPPGPPNGTLARQPVPEAERSRPSLDDAEVLRVAELCGRIATTCQGQPQDCEFAIDGDKLYFLQTRDVTASLPMEAPPLGPFLPPGKGAWELDTGHFARPATRLFQELFPAPMRAGFQKAAARYGALLSHVDMAFVNGFAYARARPLGAPEDANAKPPPPAWLFKAMVRVVPALRQRLRTAARIYETREWRLQYEEWQSVKRRTKERNLRLQATDLGRLDDRELVAHFRTLTTHVRDMIEQHHTYNLATLLPTGDLLAHVGRWSQGRFGAGEVFGLLAGATPISADLRSPEARGLAQAIAADEGARALLRLGEAEVSLDDEAAAEALAALRSLTGPAGEQVRTFLELREYRLVEGFDVSAPCLRECPALLFRALRTAARATGELPSDAIDAQLLARCRAAIPAEHHDELDRLLAEARLVMPLRDERALYSDVWAWGILRTVILHMGQRIIDRQPGRLGQPGDLCHASSEEIEGLLLRGEGPPAPELATRAAFQRAYTTRDAPARLGPPPYPPPPPELLPPAGARLTAAVMGIMSHVLAPPGVSDGNSQRLKGFAASSGVFEGVVHVVNSHSDAKDLGPDAVLVVGTGSSSFTMLAPLASAVIAEGGGLLSHVAIVCREDRFPCVCNCPGVLSSLRSGQRVRVDGTHGTVEVLPEPT